ncbi:MAG: hypothetical protein JW800_00030 [Candidatus Omnitrophica bacterium]|nr:hypothetical protein [Candidatus Omnitrophota bacterium]
MKRDRGIALLLAIGILMVLALIATSFALTMRLEYRAAMNYYHGVKARFAAEAALNKAISDLRDDAKSGAFDTLYETWATGGIEETVTTSTESIHCEAVVADENRKLNINIVNGDLLDDLIYILINFGSNNPPLAGTNHAAGYYSGVLEAGDGTAIYQRRPAGGYQNIWHIVSISANASDSYNDITAAKMHLLKDFLTTNSYDSAYNHININTADRAVMAAALVYNVGLSDAKAWLVAGCIQNDRPFGSWLSFHASMDAIAAGGYGGITQTEADNIKDAMNPNRGGGLVFGFNSGGYYGVTAKGHTVIGGNQIAEQTLFAIVKIYDIIYVSDEGDFAGALGDDYADFEKVNWLDEAPIRVGGNFWSGDTLPGSLKLGYLDDFNDPRYTKRAFGNAVASNLIDVDGDGSKDLPTSGTSHATRYAFDSFKFMAGQYFASYPTDSNESGAYVLLWGYPNAEVSVSHSLSKDGGDQGDDPCIMHPFKDFGYGSGYPYNSYEPGYGYYDTESSSPAGNGQEDVTFLDPDDIDGDPWDPYPKDKYERLKYFPSWQDYYDFYDGGGTNYYPIYIRLWPNSDRRRNSDYTSDMWNWASPQPIEYIALINNTYSGEPDRDNNFSIYGPEIGDITIIVEGTLFLISDQSSWQNNFASTRSGPITVGSSVSCGWKNMYILGDDGTYFSQRYNPSNNNGWCSMTGTLALWNDESQFGNVVLQSSFDPQWAPDYDACIATAPYGYGHIDLSDPMPESSFGGTTKPDFQFKALLEGVPIIVSGSPALDDVTITYLCPTIMRSYHVTPPE